MNTWLPVILCGGSGTRLWPLSREHFPKQFVALAAERSLFQQTLLRLEGLDQAGAVHRFSVERRPEGDRFRHLHPFLELRRLQLHADPVLERVAVAERIESQDRNGAAIGTTKALDAFHRCRFPRAVGTDESEDFTGGDIEGHVVHRNRGRVGFSDGRDVNDVQKRPAYSLHF